MNVFRRFHLVALLTVVSAVALLPGSAAAHNTLLSSDPAEGAVLPDTPTQISLVFDLPAPLETASLEVIDASGVRTDLAGLSFGPAGETEIVAALPPGLQGAVTVRWRLVGPDGHPLTGRIAFTVAPPSTTAAPSTTAFPDAAAPASSDPEAGAAVTSAPPAGPSAVGTVAGDTEDMPSGTPEAVRWTLRFASYAAIAVLIGILLTDRLVWPGFAGRPYTRRILSRSLATVALLAFFQLLVVAGDITGASALNSFGALDSATLTDAGFAYVVRMLLAGVMWLLVCQMRIVHDEIRWTALTIAGIAMMGTWAWAGHSKSQRWSWMGVPLDIVHHTAAALWIGSLAIIGTTALRQLDRVELEEVMRRLSTVAAWTVGLLVVSGLVQSVRLVGRPMDVLDVSHGRYLAIKLLLLAAMLGVANLNRVRVASTFRHADRVNAGMIARLRQSILAELGVGVVIIAVTAAMVVSPPATSRTPAAGPGEPASSVVSAEPAP